MPSDVQGEPANSGAVAALLRLKVLLATSDAYGPRMAVRDMARLVADSYGVLCDIFATNHCAVAMTETVDVKTFNREGAEPDDHKEAIARRLGTYEERVRTVSYKLAPLPEG